MSSIQVIFAGTASMQIISLRLMPSDNDVISLLWINSAIIKLMSNMSSQTNRHTSGLRTSWLINKIHFNIHCFIVV